MEQIEDYVGAIQRAIRAQDKARVFELLEDSLFEKISAPALSNLLAVFSPFFQDKDLIYPFANHTQFNQISTSAFSQILLAAIRLGIQEELIDQMLEYPHINELSKDDVHQIIHYVLQFQGFDTYRILKRKPIFARNFSSHLDEMVFCGLRTINHEWLEQLFKEPHYSDIAHTVFLEVIRWLFKNKNKKLLAFALRRQPFDEQIELLLKQELFNAFLGNENKGNRIFEEYILIQLLKHPDFNHFTPIILSWMAEKAIAYENSSLEAIVKHPNFKDLSSPLIADLFLSSLPAKDAQITKNLIALTEFKNISGNKLGLILEKAMELESIDIIHVVLNHPNYNEIPEDTFRRVAILEMQHTNQKLKEQFLQEPLLQPKYKRIIFEAIRRNDSDLIESFLKEPFLKKIVIEQLIQYATADQMFINQYIIRDVIRLGFLTKDKALITQLIQNPLFNERIKELLVQTIQFDDEELIECMLNDPLLKERMREAIHHASIEDRKRLYHVFHSQSNFLSKPKELIQEVNSWLTG